MNAACTIQLHVCGQWHDVGSVSLLGPAAHGWRAKTYAGYDIAWAMEHAGKRDAHAFSCQFRVGLEPLELLHWPPFLIDMLPQGFGREELVHRLKLADPLAVPGDWHLLLAGAGNSIGNLRVKEAALWLTEHQGPLRGFHDDEIAARGDEFSEYLAAHGLFVAGSSGIQGEWPKLLLTRAEDGLLYLDHTLSDHRAREHFIVKFARGTNARLAQILRHEEVYMALAQRLGLRVHGPLRLRERALFIPRFDRRVHDAGVVRLGQESIATFTGRTGFGVVPSHDEVCRQLVRRCTRPQIEVLEYLRRDVANLALGNKDNHARNTALQRDFAGLIGLTPLYDFAPMYLHPDGIARRIRWESEATRPGQPDWACVVDDVCLSSRPQPGESHAPLDREALVQGLREMVPALKDIAEHGPALGMEADVHLHLKMGLERLASELVALR